MIVLILQMGKTETQTGKSPCAAWSLGYHATPAHSTLLKATQTPPSSKTSDTEQHRWWQKWKAFWALLKTVGTLCPEVSGFEVHSKLHVEEGCQDQ